MDETLHKKTEQITEGGSLLQLAAIVEESHDAIIGKTLEGVITSWNGGATKMFGYLPMEVIGKSMASLFPQELKDELPRLLEKVRRGEVIADYDSIWLRKNGTRADVEFSISPVHSEAGVIVGASLVGRDISERKKGEELMRQIQLIVENSQDAIIGIIGETRSGIITSWNGGATKMFGYTAAEAVGKPLSFLIPSDKKNQASEILEKIIAGEAIADYDSEWLRKDGSTIDVALSVSPIMSVDGTVIGASIVERDITMRRKSEYLLRQTQSIVENSYDAIIGETLEGIILSWNGGAVKTFGYSADEVVGKSVSMLLSPDKKDEMSTLLNQVKNGDVIADYDTVRIHKDGSRIDVSLSVSPIKTEDGTIVGASVVERDIRARKKEEESMRQIQLIVENSQDSIFAVSLEGIVLSWNGGAKRMFGYASSEIVGKSVSILFAPERIGDVAMLIGRVKQKEHILNYEAPVLRKDGSVIEISAVISPIFAEGNGNTASASVIVRDITERKKSEERIKELNEVRSKFISIISHQLRTPLTSINWNLEMVLNGDFGKLEDITRKFLLVTHGASVDITNRIHDLLAAMDIEEGRVVFNTEEVSLGSIVAGIVGEMKNKAELKGVSVHYVAPTTELPSVEVDSEKIRTAINKLVENAIIYNKEGGDVVVRLEARDRMCHFEVRDTGIGVPEQEQHYIFDRFFRASNASIMQPDAFGLGLFIVHSFIKQHGGNIGFTSKEGEGSTFWFEIPIKQVRQ